MSNPNDPAVKLYAAIDANQLARTHWGAPKAFYASNAGNCERQLWYLYTGHRPAPGSAWLGMVAEAGNLGHDHVRQALTDTGTEILDVEFKDGEQTETGAVRKTFTFPDDVEFQVSIRPDGRIDISKFYDVEEGKNPLAALEIKTIDGFSAQWMTRAFKGTWDKYPEGGVEAVERWMRNNENKAKYFDQMQMSMGMMGCDYGYLVIYDRSMGQLGLYDDKKDLRLGGIVVPFDPERYEQLLAKFVRITGSKRSGIAPPALLLASSRTCKQCDYRYRCHDADKREQQGKTPYVVYPVEGDEGTIHHAPKEKDKS